MTVFQHRKPSSLFSSPFPVLLSFFNFYNHHRSLFSILLCYYMSVRANIFLELLSAFGSSMTIMVFLSYFFRCNFVLSYICTINAFIRLFSLFPLCFVISLHILYDPIALFFLKLLVLVFFFYFRVFTFPFILFCIAFILHCQKHLEMLFSRFVVYFRCNFSPLIFLNLRV